MTIPKTAPTETLEGAFLTNGKVAWPIEDEDLAEMYEEQLYTVPAGWVFLKKITVPILETVARPHFGFYHLAM